MEEVLVVSDQAQGMRAWLTTKTDSKVMVHHDDLLTTFFNFKRSLLHNKKYTATPAG